MGGELPEAKERGERDETQRHALVDRRRVVEEANVEFLRFPHERPAADLRETAIEDGRARGLLGYGPLRHALEIALAVDGERRVILQAEPGLDRRPGARIFGQDLARLRGRGEKALE